jgi:hypothetical protein
MPQRRYSASSGRALLSVTHLVGGGSARKLPRCGVRSGARAGRSWARPDAFPLPALKLDRSHRPPARRVLPHVALAAPRAFEVGAVDDPQRFVVDGSRAETQRQQSTPTYSAHHRVAPRGGRVIAHSTIVSLEGTVGLPGGRRRPATVSSSVAGLRQRAPSFPPARG